MATDPTTLGELTAAPYNPRTMTDEAAVGLTASMAAFGDLGGIVFNRTTGNLVAGHQRVARLQAEHGDDLAIVDGGIVLPDGGTWPVRIVEWDEALERAANLAANNPALQGDWTDNAGDLLAAVEEDNAALFDDLRLDSLAETLAPAPTTGKRHKRRRAARLRSVPRNKSKRGEVYELGPHRLMCGDSFDEADRGVLLDGVQVAMVLTDPPYAIYGSSTGVAEDIADDAMILPFFRDLWRVVYEALFWFGHGYLHCDWRSWSALWIGCKQSGMSPRNMLVWDKGGAGLGSNWANTHELLMYACKLPPQTAMGERPVGQRSVHRPNMLRHKRVRGDDRLHNAAKPVGLLAEVLDASSDPGGVVLDLFGGSGSTIIAAAENDRVACVMEKEPKWADVIRQRWTKWATAAGVEVGSGGLVGEPESVDTGGEEEAS